MKLVVVVAELRRAEADLAGRLEWLADRHRAEHEIRFVARDLARWSREHARELAAVEANLPRRWRLPVPKPSVVTSAISDLLTVFPASSLALIRDLRVVHGRAVEVSLDWELLAQAAQATKDRALLALCQRCHSETLRQLRWTNGKLKELGPQILAS